MINALIPLAVLLALIALGGLTDIVLNKKDWLLIVLNVSIWGCFLYLIYLVLGA